ncbi:MAG: ferric reductase-like transmembrane domain-containing protein [Anaerolineales bacterium]|nr:ferric reductase-like transmembrane domain-containing protein [Anaerolineales bacterium]MCB0028340.1 ferric reductase-like transmembrane domain-containing protein [Anaerolineales bacterium]
MKDDSTLQRHVIVGAVAVGLALPFWFGRLDWDPEMRFWRAVGDSSFLLLFFTLAIGPMAKLQPRFAKWVPWRREAGIWFGLMAFLHTFLVWQGWARWDIWRFLGYEFIPELNRLARLEPGFGLSNIVGMVAVLLTALLVATSSNWAVNKLGASAWKWLQYGSYTVFYLVVIHTLYFLFLHYTESFHRPVPDNLNWFRLPFLILSLTIPVLQAMAFLKTVRSRQQRGDRADGQERRRRRADRQNVSTR